MHTQQHSTRVCSHLLHSNMYSSVQFSQDALVFSHSAQLQLLEKSHTRGSHHGLTSKEFADGHSHCQHKEGYLDTLQHCALRLHGFGCVDVLTFVQEMMTVWCQGRYTGYQTSTSWSPVYLFFVAGACAHFWCVLVLGVGREPQHCCS